MICLDFGLFLDKQWGNDYSDTGLEEIPAVSIIFLKNT